MKSRPYLFKALAVGGITLLLCAALARIGGIVDERQGRQHEAERSVETSLAGRQALLGPVLHRSCVEEWDTTVGEGKDRRVTTDKREFRLSLAPTRLHIDASAALEPRYRGLFKVNAYATKATLQAQWASLAPLVAQREHAGSRLACGEPILMVALNDARGIRLAQVRANGSSRPVLPGTFHGSYPRGFHSVLAGSGSLAEAPAPGTALTADLTLELVGTAELAIAPVADTTLVQLRSDWPHPSFGGRFLPAEREVRSDGFSATWRVSSLATTAAQDYTRGAELCAPAGNAAANPYNVERWAAAAAEAAAGQKPRGCVETLDVAFIDPVNAYSLSDRATKYGLLFIALTFAIVAMCEVLGRVKVHPIQYALVGAALTLFFLLLLSLSEHLAFAWAYAAASAGVVALLGYYGAHVLGGWRAGSLFGGGAALLYGVLYVLLQMEQTALVMGSLLLFGVLGAVMVLTRRVDWYALLGRDAAASGG